MLQPSPPPPCHCFKKYGSLYAMLTLWNILYLFAMPPRLLLLPFSLLVFHHKNITLWLNSKQISYNFVSSKYSHSDRDTDTAANKTDGKQQTSHIHPITQFFFIKVYALFICPHYKQLCFFPFSSFCVYMLRGIFFLDRKNPIHTKFHHINITHQSEPSIVKIKILGSVCVCDASCYKYRSQTHIVSLSVVNFFLLHVSIYIIVIIIIIIAIPTTTDVIKWLGKW